MCANVTYDLESEVYLSRPIEFDTYRGGTAVDHFT